MTTTAPSSTAPSPSSSRDNDIGVIALRWWRSLTNRDVPAARRAWAELRRSHTVAEIGLTPAYAQLLGAIRDSGQHDSGVPGRVAAIALALAGIAPEQGMGTGNFAHAASPTGKDRAPVSELRFRRLLEINDRARLAAALRRVVPLMPGVPVPDLARSVFFWGDDCKRRWAEQYWVGFALDADKPFETNSSEEDS